MNSPYFLKSNYDYVPIRLMNKIDTVTESIAENGLKTFYISMDTFKRNFFQKTFLEHEVDESEALTLDQLKRPMMLVFILWGVAIIIHLIQKFVFKLTDPMRV